MNPRGTREHSLTHSHSMADPRSEHVAEMSHVSDRARARRRRLPLRSLHAGDDDDAERRIQAQPSVRPSSTGRLPARHPIIPPGRFAICSNPAFASKTLA